MDSACTMHKWPTDGLPPLLMFKIGPTSLPVARGRRMDQAGQRLTLLKVGSGRHSDDYIWRKYLHTDAPDTRDPCLQMTAASFGVDK